MRLLALAAWLTATSIFAQTKPSLSAYPLEFAADSVFAPTQADHLKKYFSTVRDESGALTPLRSELVAAAQKNNRKTCRDDDVCLAAFAKATQSLYALGASVSVVNQTTLEIIGWIVRDDGKRIREGSVKMPLKQGDYGKALQELTRALLVELGTANLPAARASAPVAEVKPVKVEEKPVQNVEPKTEPKPEPVVEKKPEIEPLADTTNLDVTKPVATQGPGKALFIGGAVGAVAGAAVFTTAVLMGTGTVENNAVKEGSLDTFKTARTLSGVGLSVMGVGAAVAIVGGILWAGESSAPPVTVTLVPVQGGMVGAIGGAF